MGVNDAAQHRADLALAADYHRRCRGDYSLAYAVAVLTWANILAGFVSIIQALVRWREDREIKKAAADAKTISDLALQRKRIEDADNAGAAVLHDADSVRNDPNNRRNKRRLRSIEDD